MASQHITFSGSEGLGFRYFALGAQLPPLHATMCVADECGNGAGTASTSKSPRAHPGTMRVRPPSSHGCVFLHGPWPALLRV